MKRKLLILVYSLLAGLHCSPLWAEIKPFDSNSLQQILGAHQGQPFILVFWSLECPPCVAELTMLSALVLPESMPMVLVSMDSDVSVHAVEGFLRERGLAHAEQWQLSSAATPRLYYSVQRGWQGELPRSELVAANGDRRAYLGALQPVDVERWLNTIH